MTEPARHFDTVAAAYARGRPAYPVEVYDHLEASGLLHPGARLLEVGAGSGQATAELLRRGARVDAVEPGPGLADLLQTLPGPLRVLETDLEDADLEEGAYDGVVAATSLHWVDVPAVLPGLHRALRPGGAVAAWWTVFGDPDLSTPFRDLLEEIAVSTGRGATGQPRPLREAERVAELEDGGLFRATRSLLLRWTVRLTPGQVRDLFTTFPTWGPYPDLLDRVAAAAARCAGPDGTVEEHYLTAVYVAVRTD